jgi:WD40 repeat protein
MTAEVVNRPAGIVRRTSHALAVQSSALVRRGLNDLALESHWEIKPLRSSRQTRAAISPAGHAAIIAPRSGPIASSVAIHDLTREESVNWTPNLTRHESNDRELLALRWSPSGRVLLSASRDALHFWNEREKAEISARDILADAHASFAWSHNAAFFAAANAPSLRLWGCRHEEPSIAENPVGALNSVEPLTAFNPGEPEEAAFSHFGPVAFSGDAKHLAVSVKYAGEWADDAILVLRVPSLERESLIAVQGNITDLNWAPDNERIVYCAGGQVFSARVALGESTQLPFTAEICRIHPHRFVCIGFSSWLRHSSKGRIFLADVRDGRIIEECDADGVIDLCWSLEGDRAYAITRDGLAYIFEG